MSFKKQLDAILGEIECWKGYALMDQMTFILFPKISHVLIILIEKYFSNLASSNVTSYLNYSPHQFTAEEEPFSSCYKDCILTRYNSQRLCPGILLTRCLRSDTIKCLIVGEGSFKSNVIANWPKLDKRGLINFINYRRHKDYLKYFLGKRYFNIQLVLEECSLYKSVSFLIILDMLMDYL